jgi:hypothetical protein
MKRIHIFTVAVMIASMLSLSLSTPQALGSTNPVVLPPEARVQGLTLGGWHAEFWRATLEIPASQHPGLGYPWPNCYIERIGNVGLVVASWISDEIECEMPVGMMLYFNVVGSECSTAEPPPWYGGNEEELRACALQWVPEDLEAAIDGVPVQNIDQYTALSPLYQFILPEDNVLGAPAGTYDSVAYSNGFILAPLSPGEHTIEISGEVPAIPFEFHKLYHITVTK